MPKAERNLMDLPKDFYRLPLRFDAAQLSAEITAIGEDYWLPHPSGFTGNSALQLVSVGGSLGDDGLQGAQQPTPLLEACPYLRQVLATFDTTIGRTRLMRLAPGAEALAHMDANYYWHQRLRIHVPILTHPEIRFHSGASSVHMAAGECWVFNTWQMHSVVNETAKTRVHLVCDTVGSPALWDLIGQAETMPPGSARCGNSRWVPFRPGWEPVLPMESTNFPVVMSPWEQESLLGPLLDDLQQAFTRKPSVGARLTTSLLRFRRQWANHWACFGDGEEGLPGYRAALDSLESILTQVEGQFYLSNGMEAAGMIRHAVVRPALNPRLRKSRRAAVGARALRATTPCAAPAIAAPMKHCRDLQTRFLLPLIIVAAPRSGSSFLFEQLAHSPDLYTVGGESHALFENIPKLHPRNRLFDSNRLVAEDADPATVDLLQKAFLERIRDSHGQRPPPTQQIRLLEKTPKNALRIPFLDKVFPDALFVYLYRDPAESLASIVEAWQSGKFITYKDLPGWPGPPWSLLLTTGWRDLAGKNLFDIALTQWSAANEQIQQDLEAIAPERQMALSYHDLVKNPDAMLERIATFAGIRWYSSGEGELPLSQHTVSTPAADKWRVHAAAIEPRLPATEHMQSQAQLLIESSRKRRYPARGTEDPSADPESSPLRSSHTSNFADLLQQVGASLLVTTYQSGKLVVIRPHGQHLNTHFMDFARPMGLAADTDKVAIGTRNAIELFTRLPGRNGGSEFERFYRRLEHVTGNIDIHEMSWSSSGLWFINTRFSCLCSLDSSHSFVPRWQPPFISALAPEDRCHLNGMCIVDDVPRYVTALGSTDSIGGWRTDRARGGVVIDVQRNEIVAAGLSMPHSPRWHRDRLWVLESGKGSLAWVDLARGQLQPVAELPGFTRGLCFHENLAFVGLSQVRETATFGSIPITERSDERICGVWVIDIDSGKTVCWLRFHGSVNEIFAVELLPGILTPSLVQSHETALDNMFFTAGGPVHGQ